MHFPDKKASFLLGGPRDMIDLPSKTRKLDHITRIDENILGQKLLSEGLLGKKWLGLAYFSSKTMRDGFQAKLCQPSHFELRRFSESNF